MSRKLKTLALAVATTLSVQCYAQVDKSSEQKKTKFYLGGGASNIDINAVTVDNKPFKAQYGYVFSGGMIYSMTPTFFIDGRFAFSRSENELEVGTCFTSFGPNVTCEQVAVTDIFSIPVTANLHLPMSDSFGFNVGAGGAINYISRKVQLQATNYESLDQASKNHFGVSPVIQAGINIGKFRLLFENYFNIGDDEVGEGSLKTLQLQYGSSW